MPQDKENQDIPSAQLDEKDLWELQGSTSNQNLKELLESSSERFKLVEQLNNTSELEKEKRQNRSLQRKLKDERRQYCQQIQEMKDNHQEMIEKMKTDIVNKVKMFEKEYEQKLDVETKGNEKRIEKLEMDLEELSLALEDRNGRITQLESIINDWSEDEDGIQVQVDLLQAELNKRNKRIQRMISVAESTKQMIKEVEKESLVVLNENKSLKLQLRQKGCCGCSSSSDSEGVQRHPSLCDLDLEKTTTNSVGEFILPNKFNFEEIIRKSLKKL